MPQRFELRGHPFRRFAIGHGSHAHAITQRSSRAARQNVHRKPLPFHLAGQLVGVRAAGEAAQLHGPRTMPLGCGGKRGGFNRRRCAAAAAGRDGAGRRGRARGARWRRSWRGRGWRSRRLCGGGLHAGSLHRQRVGGRADDAAAAACGDGVSASAFAGALLVVKSTVTLRSGSAAAAGRVGAVATVGLGPTTVPVRPARRAPPGSMRRSAVL